MGPSKGSLLVVIAAPAGGGKTTLANELIRRFPNARRSITCTTRPPRSTEIDNQDYIFISDPDFDRMIKANEFAEWANVHSHRYGTRAQVIDEALQNGELLFMIIDVQGAYAIKKKYPNAVSIFVMPPDFDILETRLRKRGTESEGDIRLRLENARKEIARAKEFDFQVLNDQLERAVLEIESIIRKKLNS